MYGGRLLKSLPYYRRFGRPKATMLGRARFPSLHPSIRLAPIFFDNPGSAQLPPGVPDAIVHYYSTSNANRGGAFATARRTDAEIADAWQAMACLLHAPSPRTRLAGVTRASSAVGVVPPAAQSVEIAHAVGALVFVDAVQYGLY